MQDKKANFSKANQRFSCFSKKENFEKKEKFSYFSKSLRFGKKSQGGMEFMILVSVVLFVFVAFLLVIQTSMSDKINEKNNLDIKEVALIVQDEINLALKSSDGYSREFELPEKIANRDYGIELIEGLVYVETDDEKYAISFPVAELAVGSNVVKGTNLIRKEDGVVCLNV